ncbi:hypothetical protein ACVGOW_20030 [Pseudonocardia saturnea]
MKPEPADVALARIRAGLLGGRGPGATPAEVAAHTRDRDRLGGRPVAELRAGLAARTARARGEPDALAEVTASATDALAGTLAAVRERLDPIRAAGRSRVSLPAVGAAVATAVAATAALTRRGRGRG